MTALRRTTATLLLAAAGMTLTACGSTDAPGEQRAARTSSPAVAGPRPSSQTPVPTRSRAQGEQVRIGITIGDEPFQATLDDSAATRDLVGQLPVTVRMVDHGGVEKTGRLPSPLSLDGQPSGADPDVGDVGYYAPGNDLVLYYGDQTSYDGIVVLGRLDSGTAERIAVLDGSITAAVTALDD